MKGRQIDQLVYDCMFPRPKSNDPSNFHALLQRSLIPEVRQETHAFFGHLDTQEAKYPGLDYSHPTHRMRLSRWPWHRRLFRAFDSLRLTNAEIAGLTKWEGTKWAKEKFEREQGIKIQDSAADDMPNAADIEDWYPKSDHSTIKGPSSAQNRSAGDASQDSNDEMDLESEDELESVGVELNERLRVQAARREAGDSSAILDEEWEQWLKNALETGGISMLSDSQQPGAVSSQPDAVSIAPVIPPGMLSAARAGQWSEVPEFLHPMLRRTLESETPSPTNAYVQPLVEEPAQNSRLRTSQDRTNYMRRLMMEDGYEFRIPWPRRSYSDLRLPVGDRETEHRAAEAS